MDKLKYIAKRLAMAAVTMLLITVVVFIVIQLPPGNFVGPFVYGYKIERDKSENKIFVEDTEHLHQVQFFVKGTSYKLLGLIPSDRHLFGVDDSNLEEGEEPAQIMLFGADKLGRDLYSRVLLGSQVSLTVPLLGTAISFVLAVIIGGISGYYGGWVDELPGSGHARTGDQLGRPAAGVSERA